MPDDKYSLYIEHLPNAFAYHQVVWNSIGQPIDYIFIEVNPAFESMTGLQREHIIGKKVTKILPGIENSRFDWIGLYGKVALTGENLHFEQYSEPLGAWYEVTVFSYETDYFGTIFRNITEVKQKQEKLQEGIKNAVSLVDNALDMIVRFNTDLQHVYCNQAIENHLGIPKSVFIGKTFLDIEGPPKQLETMHKLLQKTLQTGQKQHTEQSFLLSTGWKYFQTQIIPEFDNGGSIVSLLAVSRDISKSKQIEQALIDNEKRLNLIMAETPAVIYSYKVLDGIPQITYINRNVSKVLGHEPEGFIKDIEFWESCVHPDDLEKLRYKLAGNESFDEYRFKEVSGKYRWLHDQQRVVKKESGFVEIVGAWWDITEKKEAEEKLHKVVSEQELLLDNIEVQVWYLKDAETYGVVNLAHARFLGLNKSDLENKRLYDILSSEDEVRLCIEGNRQVMDEKQQMHTEEWVTNGSGAPRLLSITKTPKLSSHGQVEYVVCSAVDITKEKQLQNELQERESMLSAIFQAAQHVSFIVTDICLPHTSILEFSPGAELTFGYRKEEILGQKVGILHQTQDVERLPLLVEELKNQRKGISSEMTLVRKSGETFPALFTLYPLFDSSGDLWATLGVSIDISERKQFESELQQKEEQLRGILESQQDLIVRVDLDNRLTYVNDAYCKTFGKDREELLGRSFTPLVHEEDLESTLKAMEDLFKSPYRIYLEQRAMTVNGWRWIAWEDSGILNEQCEVVEIQGVGRDITEYKQALTELEESEMRYRAIVEDQTELICRFRPDGTLTFVNLAYCRYFQKTPEELLGNSFLPLIPQEDQHIITKQQNLLTAQNPVVLYEHRVILPDGDVRWQQWFDRALYDEKGEAMEFQAVGRDITHQKVAEEELENARADLEARVRERTKELQIANEKLRDEIANRREAESSLAEEKRLLAVTLFSIGDGVITTDEDGIITFINRKAEEIACASGHKKRGKPLSTIFKIIDDEKEDNFCDNPLKTLLASQEKEISDYIFVAGDNARKLITAKASPILDEGNTVLGYVIAFRDITRLKKIEMQLALSQKLESVGRMASGIAHEINSPMQYIGDNARYLQNAFTDILNVIRRYRQLEEGLAKNHKLHDFEEKVNGLDVELLISEVPAAIADLLQGIDRVNQLIQAMSGFAHPGSKEKTFSDINKAIEGAVILTKNEWKYHANLEMECDVNLPLVCCNIGEVSQAVMNIIVNGAHAVEEALEKSIIDHGKITVKTQKEGDKVQIVISDNGIGVPSTVVEKIFDPFFTTKQLGKGTGQGLAIAYDIITMKHEGNIVVESQEGKGTVFTLSLPISGKKTK